MPYLNMRVSAPESPELAEKIAAMLQDHTSEILGKRPEVTSICIDFVPPSNWFIGGSRIQDQSAATFYLDIKVTEGTNTKVQKASYVDQVFSAMQALLGIVAPASYVVIHDISGDAWGFEGKTQEYRFVDN